jgi:GT2 family glycosyltransferase
MAGDRTIFDEPHHQSLELLATQALAEGNAREAFKLADRRCRILPLPDPHSYVLRSEASFQIGARAAAVADLAKALEIAPNYLPANRRMLTWGTGPHQTQAALALVEDERSGNMLRKAVQVLVASGQKHFANVIVLEDTIDGWAVWQDDVPLEITISDGINFVSETLEADAFHPLGQFGHAISFSIPRPTSANSQSIALQVSGNEFYSIRVAAKDTPPKHRVHRPRAALAKDRRTTVVVPIYGDYDATRLCLDSLRHALDSGRHRAILVNDATPDPKIAKYLDKLTDDPRIEVLVNARNLGFIGSVNRALSHVKQGDVILLNSDTVVPAGFIDRLAAAAQSSPDIGTVTPLSNNGEFVSFPIPNTSNPLESRHEVERIDAIATKVNAGLIVDIPSGIGFCLYITRTCLDLVGQLSEDYEAGYLEDTDICLRARAHGLRNVCAPSVFVGHAGSKSFRQEKRALVVHNLSILERRFPKHRAECGAFMAADPLRPAREAIERLAATAASHPVLLITGAGTIAAVARARASDLAAEQKPVIILEVRHSLDGPTVLLRNAAGAMPQSLQFDLSSASDCEALADFAKSVQPARVEILDPSSVPSALVDLMLGLEIPYDIFVADAGLLGPQGELFAAAAPSLMAPAAASEDGSPGTTEEPGKTDWAEHWNKIATGARRILVPCRQSEAFAARHFPELAIEKIEHPGLKPVRPKRKRQRAAVRHLGFVPARLCAQEQLFIGEVTRRLGTKRSSVATTVVGAALDDVDLMRSSNVFVTGAVTADEFEQLVDALGIGYLFVSATRPLFGHPVLTAALSSSRPVAYFDWSMGRLEPQKKDLAIDPRSSLDDVIGALNRWMPVS